MDVHQRRRVVLSSAGRAAAAGAAAKGRRRPATRRSGCCVEATVSPEHSAPDYYSERAMYDALRQRQATLSAPLAPKYKRVMLKVSGEALAGARGHGLDPAVLESFCAEIAAAHRTGVEIAVTIGGGNYWRGQTAWEGIDRATADYVGMLATSMNALCLQAALEKLGVPTRVQTAIEMKEVAEPFVRRRAIRHLEKGRVVVFGAGTGNPFMTTDTAAALRAAEVGAEVFLKATKVDGVYDCDPAKHPATARRYQRLSYRRVEADGLAVMDATAVTLCRENSVPVVVFDALRPGNILRACVRGDVGTTVADDAAGTLFSEDAESDSEEEGAAAAPGL